MDWIVDANNATTVCGHSRGRRSRLLVFLKRDRRFVNPRKNYINILSCATIRKSSFRRNRPRTYNTTQPLHGLERFCLQRREMFATLSI